MNLSQKIEIVKRNYFLLKDNNLNWYVLRSEDETVKIGYYCGSIGINGIFPADSEWRWWITMKEFENLFKKFSNESFEWRYLNELQWLLHSGLENLKDDNFKKILIKEFGEEEIEIIKNWGFVRMSPQCSVISLKNWVAYCYDFWMCIKFTQKLSGLVWKKFPVYEQIF